MRNILLMRHGKSERELNVPDFDRPLAPRGLKDVPQMGRVLMAYNSAPELIISSPAKRARQTAEILAETCGYKGKISFDESFYSEGADALLERLKTVSQEINVVMLVGHNPCMEQAASAFCSGDTSYTAKVALPTSAIVCFEAELPSWDKFRPGCCVFKWLVIPRLVKAIKS